MTSETKPVPATSESLENAVFECQTEQDRMAAVDKAFDYRGDVTLELHSGQKVEGYLFNRDTKSHPARVELFVKGQNDSVIVPYADIHTIAFTGSDPATGKSWRDWVAKKDSERKAEAEKIRLESIQRGEL